MKDPSSKSRLPVDCDSNSCYDPFKMTFMVGSVQSFKQKPRMNIRGTELIPQPNNSL